MPIKVDSFASKKALLEIELWDNLNQDGRIEELVAAGIGALVFFNQI